MFSPSRCISAVEGFVGMQPTKTTPTNYLRGNKGHTLTTGRAWPFEETIGRLLLPNLVLTPIREMELKIASYSDYFIYTYLAVFNGSEIEIAIWNDDRFTWFGLGGASSAHDKLILWRHHRSAITLDVDPDHLTLATPTVMI